MVKRVGSASRWWEQHVQRPCGGQRQCTFKELEIKSVRGLWYHVCWERERQKQLLGAWGLITVQGQCRLSDWEFEKMAPCCWVDRGGGEGIESTLRGPR